MAAICRSLVLALMVSRFTGIMASDDDPYDAICSPIWGYFPDCAEYLGGLTHHLPEKCCHSIRKLNEIAKKTKRGPNVVCFCIESYMVPQDFHLRIKKLPKKCHTDILFPIYETMNCSLVKLSQYSFPLSFRFFKLCNLLAFLDLLFFRFDER
ncbi:hypothetical protein OIU85_021885 [Salix viminalis]|uniref:Bifunctional inhibitor/plant lipid transfer protein/seed storage helical domain-containing protein n=1 Tax=Salix viminalis TaxID=40686 RepID=A0A9Q0ZE37_SALVM|nr:hypothetical protein OIU85_021885 [Salix viminalis]